MKLDKNVQIAIGAVFAIIIIVAVFMLLSNKPADDSPIVLSAQITEENMLLQPPIGRCSADGVSKAGEELVRPEFSHYVLVGCMNNQVCCYESSSEPMGVCAREC